MILERFFDDRLAQASYLIGCAATGEALVIDPARDIDPYLAAAQRHDVHLTHVTETHIHADFLSGSREMGTRTGATVYLSREGGPDWQYGWASDAGATLVGDGDVFMVGNVRVEVLHTPGHTPEHLSFIITDTAATDIPMGIFTGDFLFVGDVGRPDLLEKAAHIAGTMEKGARQLYQSLRRLDGFPGYLQIWPGHGAGSACGKALGAIPSTTLDYERAVNWAFQAKTEQAFVDEVLTGQPEPPFYFAHMKRLNRDGPPLLAEAPTPGLHPPADLAQVLQEGRTVIDVRPWERFRQGHVPGTIHIPLDSTFTTWAGWLVPFDEPFYLVADLSTDEVRDATRALRSIGLDQVMGFFDARALHDATMTTREMTVDELAARRDDVVLLDVRGASEWSEGHLPGSMHIPLGYLSTRLDELPRDRTIVPVCLTGVRSAIATSVLQAHGVNAVTNLAGGYAKWIASGREVVPEDAAVAQA